MASVRTATDLPLIVKLSPNVTDIRSLARTAVAAGADILSLINTLTGMAVDLARRKPALANVTGGLSGPAIKPVALRCIIEVREATKLPILGVGGVRTAEDVCEFLVAGANAVQIGTAHFADPLAAVHILSELSEVLVRNGTTVHNLQSSLVPPEAPSD